jgi:hypothetical protein
MTPGLLFTESWYISTTGQSQQAYAFKTIIKFVYNLCLFNDSIRLNTSYIINTWQGNMTAAKS